jgi:hypothetical protein
MKRASDEAQPDRNFPGLIVCQQGCNDEKDPYRLPARKTEKITIRYPRPDESVAVNNDQLVTTGYAAAIISTEGNLETPQNDGNLTEIIPSPPSS